MKLPDDDALIGQNEVDVRNEARRGQHWPDEDALAERRARFHDDDDQVDSERERELLARDKLLRSSDTGGEQDFEKGAP